MGILLHVAQMMLVGIFLHGRLARLSARPKVASELHRLELTRLLQLLQVLQVTNENATNATLAFGSAGVS